MTEKDAVRCQGFNLKNLWYLKIETDLPDSFSAEIAKKIKEKTSE